MIFNLPVDTVADGTAANLQRALGSARALACISRPAPAGPFLSSSGRQPAASLANSILLLTLWTNRTNLAAMKTVNVHEAKTNFSSLLATVEDFSESFVICRNGEPVADLVPHKKVNRLKPHPVLSKIKINYDPTEPLSENAWPKASR
jgi:antitoxin (DNA-binding transcriptional repressor) of toxin-antitoxin stability system